MTTQLSLMLSGRRVALAMAVAAGLSLGLGACSGGNITNDLGLPQNDNGLPTPDHTGGPDVRGDTGGGGQDNQVPQGNGAAYMTVAATPARSYYHTGQDVTLKATIKDQDGNVLTNIDVGWTADPAASATAGTDPGAFTFAAEGSITFQGCTTDNGVQGKPVCGSITLVVDDASPSLEVTSPTPGAELGGDGATAITVTGSVTDTQTSTVYVNGTPTQVDSMGAFTVDVVPFFGTNHIEVVASDGVTPGARVEMDVLWAEGYLPAVDSTSGRPSLVLDDGISLQLGQPLFDDGQALDTSVQPIITKDLADVLQLVISNLDVFSQLPNGGQLSNTSTLNLAVTAVRLNQTTIEFNVLDTGLELYVRIGQLQADTSGALTLQNQTLNLGGGIDALVSAYARIGVSKPAPDQPIAVSVDDLVITLEQATPHFTDDDANAVFKVASSALHSTLQTQISNAFQGTLSNTLPGLLFSLLNALDTALANKQIPLMTQFFPAVTIDFDGRVAAVETAYRDHLRATLRTAIGTESTAVMTQSRGVASSEPGGGVTDLPFFHEARLQLALRLTVLNGLLHGLWNSGLLEIDAKSLIPDSLQMALQMAVLSGKLPPVARPPRPNEAYDLVLNIGQLELTTKFQNENTRFGITFDAGVTLSVDGNRISVNIADMPDVKVWIIETDAEMPVLNGDLLKSILISTLWPQLSGAFSNGLGFDLPIPSLGDLTSLAPALAGFSLSLSESAPVTFRDGILVFEADLLGTLP
jgi:hypothetical protein